jgi:hypothetical protein
MRRDHAPVRKLRRKRSAGQALAEFALVVPMFVLLLMAIMEGGRFVFYYEMLSSASREGARYAIVHGSNSLCPSGPMPGGATNTCDPTGNNVKQAAKDSAIGIAGTGELFVSDPAWPVSNGRGESVTVAVQYTYRPLLPALPQITISARSTLVINN